MNSRTYKAAELNIYIPAVTEIQVGYRQEIHRDTATTRTEA